MNYGNPVLNQPLYSMIKNRYFLGINDQFLQWRIAVQRLCKVQSSSTEGTTVVVGWDGRNSPTFWLVYTVIKYMVYTVCVYVVYTVNIWYTLHIYIYIWYTLQIYGIHCKHMSRYRAMLPCTYHYLPISILSMNQW